MSFTTFLLRARQSKVEVAKKSNSTTNVLTDVPKVSSFMKHLKRHRLPWFHFCCCDLRLLLEKHLYDFVSDCLQLHPGHEDMANPSWLRRIEVFVVIVWSVNGPDHFRFVNALRIPRLEFDFGVRDFNRRQDLFLIQRLAKTADRCQKSSQVVLLPLSCWYSSPTTNQDEW